MCTPQSSRAIDPARSINVRVASIAASPLRDQFEIITPVHAVRPAGREMQRHVPLPERRDRDRAASGETRGVGVKQQLAAVRMLFDWLITGQIVPQGRHQAFDIVEGAEWRKLLDSILAVNAALKMKVEDLRSRGAGGMVRLHEKGGKEPAMPCHHALAE